MTLGPVITDIEGTCLSEEERALLRHPAVGGVILFSRNYESPEQLRELTAAIHALRDPHLLIAVDQEGGRVQRFREGFTLLPPAGRIGALYARAKEKARELAELTGWLMAAELRAVGIDFSFAPVLDLDPGVSQVIGDRAFHARPIPVAELAGAWMRGMHSAGMPAVGKHFPGHGHVEEDSHVSLPVDHRRREDILMEDVIPFERLIHRGLEAVMPAHVVYDRVDPNPAGFSPYWLQGVLRNELGFQGMIFSDDLNMGAADEAGGFADRAKAALDAGCDSVLICNNRPATLEIIEALTDRDDPVAHLRMMRMHGKSAVSPAEVRLDPRWKTTLEKLAALEHSKDLSLDLGIT